MNPFHFTLPAYLPLFTNLAGPFVGFSVIALSIAFSRLRSGGR